MTENIRQMQPCCVWFFLSTSVMSYFVDILFLLPTRLLTFHSTKLLFYRFNQITLNQYSVIKGWVYAMDLHTMDLYAIGGYAMEGLVVSQILNRNWPLTIRVDMIASVSSSESWSLTMVGCELLSKVFLALSLILVGCSLDTTVDEAGPTQLGDPTRFDGMILGNSSESEV